VVKVDDAGRGAHRACCEQPVEGEVRLESVEGPAQQPLGAEFRIRADEPARGIFGLAAQEIGDRIAGGKPVLERRVNAAGRDRRHHAGGIADEQHA
jgi:hypothetical protein